jgi:hypothetical protein
MQHHSQKTAYPHTEGVALSDADGGGSHMAVGQRKVLAQRTYGVGLESGARSSPDSSGSPQRREVAAAS